MLKFKVGDVIKFFYEERYRILGSNEKNYELISIDGVMGGKPFWWPKESTEKGATLVTTLDSELESLIEKANEYAKIIDVLRVNYFDEIEFRSVHGSTWRQLATRTPKNFEYRIKPKVKFEPFTVGSWTVDYNPHEKEIRIGCQQFNAYDLKSSLNSLCKYNYTRVIIADEDMVATRKGVSWKGHNLTWAEAERILEALEKVSV